MLSSQNKNLNEFIICKVCKKYLKDPVLLPCGENVCKQHVDLNEAENKSKYCNYKCELCKEIHQILSTGFSNKVLVKILKFNIHSYKDSIKVQKAVNKFDKVIKELSLLCKDPANFIVDYFSASKSKIDLENDYNNFIQIII